MKRFLLTLIAAYQHWISPARPRRCRYEPTCSAYAGEAISELGATRGTIVAGWRLLRCNPFSNGGIDDVCDRSLFNSAAGDTRRDCNHDHIHPRPQHSPAPGGPG